MITLNLVMGCHYKMVLVLDYYTLFPILYTSYPCLIYPFLAHSHISTLTLNLFSYTLHLNYLTIVEFTAPKFNINLSCKLV